MSKPMPMPLTLAQRTALLAIHEHGAYTFTYSRGPRPRQFRLRGSRDASGDAVPVRSTTAATLTRKGLITFDRFAAAPPVTLTDAGRLALGLDEVQS